MVSNNTFTRYAYYAIGEIALVMIGILLALQVNNWNEDRKRQNDIGKSLTQILNDLKEDQVTLNYFLETETAHNSYLREISNGNNTSQGLDTILTSLDHYFYFTKSNNGYSGLKDSGKISEIKNEALKSGLTTYYEVTYEGLMAATEFSETFTNNQVIPYTVVHLEPGIDRSTRIELVLEKLETTDLRYLINYQIGVKEYTLGQVRNGLRNNQNLTAAIETELGLDN